MMQQQARIVTKPSTTFVRKFSVRARKMNVTRAQLSQDELKQQAAWKAVEYVKSGMVVGLGTGSTAAFAGRGGALLREKMVEMASDTFVCIVDESKLVDGLGGSKDAMPIEIVQFCHEYTLRRIAALPEVAGCEARLRMDGDAPYVTDNSNYIVDLYFQTPIKDSHAAAKAIMALEGVVDHGLFLDMVNVCIIAGSNGIEVKERQ
eukprot:jgi/Picre1/28803/NNA_004200.t1